ncbi:MAG: sigma-54 dependent transcriptional regulator [Thermodesulfobacteriota bacterium]
MNQRENRGQILYVDDEPEVRESTSQTLMLAGFDVLSFSTAHQLLEHVLRNMEGIVVTDVKMPQMDGLALLSRVLEVDEDIPVVLVSGHGDIPMAVQAIRDGAYDFVEKAGDPDEFVDVVRRAVEKRKLVIENRTLRRELDCGGELEQLIVGKSSTMEMLRQTIINLAATDVDILIRGETGTGKELAARCLHDFGPRRDHPFVAVNCGALPETIIESELFGHEPGAFTGADKLRIGKFEYGDGGTLFLDEIESMPVGLQVKLLRVLQERVVERLGKNRPIPVDIRVIAASKVDLLQASEQGLFRADLYYRLNVVNIELPPLRTISEDSLLLFTHFCELAGKRYKKVVPKLNSQLTGLLHDHDWPGNMRELRNMADRFVLGLPPDCGGSATSSQEQPAGDDLSGRLESYEKKIIVDELTRHDGRVGETARALSIPRKKLYLRMRKYGLERKEYQ